MRATQLPTPARLEPDLGTPRGKGLPCAVGAALMVWLATLGCAPTYHTAPRYRFDPRAADAVNAEAEARCRARGHPAGKPTRTFVTDGCSMWPDGAWQRCCVEHDMEYWCGGSAKERSAADDALRQCAADAYSDWRGPLLGALMRTGVWAGGPHWLPAYWRWGYGHEYPKGYTGCE